MPDFLEAYRRLLAAIGAVERLLVILLIVVIVASIGTQVVSRYVFDLPLVWVEELATYAFIWATFVGASLGLKHGRHIKIGTFVSRMTPSRAAIFRLIGHAAVLCLAVVLVQQAWTVAGIEGRRTSISLPVALPISLFFSIPLLVGMVSVALTTVFLALQELHRLVAGVVPVPIMADGLSGDGPDEDEDAAP